MRNSKWNFIKSYGYKESIVEGSIDKEKQRDGRNGKRKQAIDCYPWKIRWEIRKDERAASNLNFETWKIWRVAQRKIVADRHWDAWWKSKLLSEYPWRV
mgnify:FL=1